MAARRATCRSSPRVARSASSGPTPASSLPGGRKYSSRRAGWSSYGRHGCHESRCGSLPCCPCCRVVRGCVDPCRPWLIRRLRGLPLTGFLVGRLADGVLCPLARVDRVAEGLAVVALVDGGAGFVQTGRRRGVFLGGEPLRAGVFRQVHRALRLVDFLLGRLGAARHVEQQECEEPRDPPKASHGGKV